MGEARRRGSFEKRKREAIARNEAMEKKRLEVAEQLKQRTVALGRQGKVRGRAVLATAFAIAASTATIIDNIDER